MKFLTEIKAALKKAGLSEDLADQIDVETVGEVEGAVGKLKADTDRVSKLSPEEFIKAVEKAGLGEPLKKFLAAETDRRVKEATATQEENLRKQAEAAVAKKLADAAEAEKIKKGEINPEDVWKKSIEDTLGKLTEALTGVTTTIAKKDISGEVGSALKEAGIAADFADYISVSDVAEIPGAIKALKDRLDASHQSVIDKRLEAGELSPVKKGAAGGSLEEDQIAAYAATKTANGVIINPDFPGKITAKADEPK